MAAFESLVHQKRIELAPDDLKKASESKILERLSKANENDLRIANHRSGFIVRYLHERSLPPTTDVSNRTFYRWLVQYRESEVAVVPGIWVYCLDTVRGATSPPSYPRHRCRK